MIYSESVVVTPYGGKGVVVQVEYREEAIPYYVARYGEYSVEASSRDIAIRALSRLMSAELDVESNRFYS